LGNYLVYVVYEVIKELSVIHGPVAAWFEQPVMGTQYTTVSNVTVLVNDKFLRRLNRTEYDEKAEFAENYTTGPTTKCAEGMGCNFTVKL
jgi:hypothetical protein